MPCMSGCRELSAPPSDVAFGTAGKHHITVSYGQSITFAGQKYHAVQGEAYHEKLYRPKKYGITHYTLPSKRDEKISSLLCFAI